MTKSPRAHKQYTRLSVIVPVYNERSTVGEVIRRVRAVEPPGGLDLELVVVDDGSTDGTDKVLAMVEDSTVKVVKHAVNRGKGAAIRTGLTEARGDVVLFQDADLEYSIDDWPRLLAPVLDGRALVVYGSRFHPERETMSLTGFISDRALSLFTCVLYNTTLTDVETGYKVFDRAFLDGLTIESDGFAFESEVTAKVLRSGQRIYEVPISFTRRDANEGRKYTSKDSRTAFMTLFKHRFKKRI